MSAERLEAVGIIAAFVGTLGLVCGVALLSVAAACIVAGSILMFAGVALAYASNQPDGGDA